MDIGHLELTKRSEHALRSAGLHTLEQVLELSHKQLASVHNLGKKSFDEVVWALVQALRGDVFRRAKEFEVRFPGARTLKIRELIEKSRKYDEIVQVISRERRAAKKDDVGT